MSDADPGNDDDGAVHGLIEEAAAFLTQFVTSDEVKAELATNLWHSRTKLERAVSSDDPHVAAYVGGLAVPDLLDALLALHNRPCVPGSHRMNVLATLNLDSADRLLLDELLVGQPLVRARAAVALRPRSRAPLTTKSASMKLNRPLRHS